MNVATYLEESAARHPDKAAIRFLGDSITFGELNAASSRLAGGLAALGLKPGDRCLVILPNSIRQVTLYYALAKLGAIEVPVNFLYRVHEITHIVKDSEPAAFIGAEPYLEEISKVLADREAPSICLVIGATEKHGFASLDGLFSGPAGFATYPADENDTFNILYTSGTTGASKGVMLTHKNLARNAKIISEMRGAIEPDTVIIGVLPLYHIYGITSVLNSAMYMGLTMELFPHFDPEKVMEVVEREKRTLLFAVPTMYNRLIQLSATRPPASSSLKFCISGGASLPVEFLHRFEALFRAKIYEGYGLTEAPVCIENPYGRPNKPGSIGVPIPEFAARIVDERGNEVGAGETGELLVKGPGVMKGYWNLPEETNRTIRDGWLYTGDIARTDEDGYYYIVDRKKDLVIRGGYNVYPREIEEVLYQIPDIVEAAVFGLPHEDLGEEIAAVVHLKEGAAITTEDIRAYVKAKVAPYKYPRLIKITAEPFPKTGSGKILKRELRERFETL